MDDNSHIHLVYTPKRTSHVQDSLYHMMRGDCVKHEWEIGEAKLHESGFQLVYDNLRCDGIPSAAVFLHYPSGSAVVVTEDHFNPSVKIYGSRKESAKSSLVELVKPFGFDLREAEAQQLQIMAADKALSGRGVCLEYADDGS